MNLRRGGEHVKVEGIALSTAVALLALSAAATETLSGRARVVDGDTVEVRGPVRTTRVRLHGIDAPALAQSCTRGGASYSCGVEARHALEDIIGSAELSCQPKGKGPDGVMTATCYAGDRDIGRELVRAGHAVTRHAAVPSPYALEQDQARTMRRGLWSGTFQAPADAAREHRR
jgi:endonuclease YncB( thermonuclease family)